MRPDARSGMPAWQDKLFIFLAQNADDASSYFQLPTDRVVEIGTQVDIMSTSFFLSRRSLRPDPRSGMPTWQDRLFIFLAHNADDASSYFQLPTDRVVEIGTQVTV